MTPWRYVNLIIEKLQSSGSATFDQIYSYCIVNADRIDPGDKTKIIKLIEHTLEPLCYYGTLSKCGNRYKVERDLSEIELSVIDDTPEMTSITEKNCKKMNEIDKNTPYGQEPPLWN